VGGCIRSTEPGSAALRALLRDDTAVAGVTRSELEERFVALIDATAMTRLRSGDLRQLLLKT
jgi:hypothetical protein